MSFLRNRKSCFGRTLELVKGLSTEYQIMNAEMQNGRAVLADDNEQASLTKQVKTKKETIEVPSPHWLPKGWRTEKRYRLSGSTAGSSDKYYVHISTGRRCRSRPEVTSFLGSETKQKHNVETETKQLHSASDGVAGQTQGQEDSQNKNARKMSGLDSSGNAVKRRKKVHPLTGKALDYILTSSTPASQGQPHASNQNDKKLSKIDGSVSAGEAVLPPGMFVTHILDEGPENTVPKPTGTGSRARKVQCTEQSMASLVSAQAGCHGYLNSHNQPCYPVMPLENGLLNHGHCCTIFGGSLTTVPFSDLPRSPRSVLHHNSNISHSDLQVQHQLSKGRPKGSKNLGINPQEMKRRLAELGRRLCKQSLEIAPSPSTAKLESETTAKLESETTS